MSPVAVIAAALRVPVSVGLADRTTFPLPVLVVTPVPPLATGRVPVTWEVRLMVPDRSLVGIVDEAVNGDVPEPLT
jgi:hypothetical protein